MAEHTEKKYREAWTAHIRGLDPLILTAGLSVEERQNLIDSLYETMNKAGEYLYEEKKDVESI